MRNNMFFDTNTLDSPLHQNNQFYKKFFNSSLSKRSLFLNVIEKVYVSEEYNY